MRLPLLALLAKEPAHGYELRQALEQTFGQAYPAPNIGQVYVTLQRLAHDGFVRSENVVQSNRPNKRVYELTQAGREALANWVAEPSDAAHVRDQFFMKLALAPLAGAADRNDPDQQAAAPLPQSHARAVEPGNQVRPRQPDRAAADRGRHAASAGRSRLARTLPGGARLTSPKTPFKTPGPAPPGPIGPQW